MVAAHADGESGHGPAAGRRRPATWSGLLLLGVLGLAACGSAHGEPASPPPAVLQDIPGSPVRRVVLSEQGLASLQLRTGAVQDVGGHPVIPMTAVVYDPKGAPWAYRVVGPRTYVRQPLVIDHVTDGLATLASGFPPGSAVVTVGAPELLGAEYGVGEE
jgi:hypothetical protein